MWGAVAQTGSNILTSGLNLATSNYYANKQYDLNEKASQADFDRQMEYYNITHEHNSPEYIANQMREAGLNPALMHGMSGAGGAGESGGKAQGSQHVTAPQMQPMDVAGMAKLGAETELLKAQAENLRGNTKSTHEDTVAKQLDNRINMFNASIESGDHGNYRSTGFITTIDGHEIQYDVSSKLGQQTESNLKLLASNADNATATAEINWQKAEGTYKDMVTDLKNANTKEFLSKAQELATLFGIGEHVNWKTFFDGGMQSANLLLDIYNTFIGAKGKGVITPTTTHTVARNGRGQVTGTTETHRE